MDNEIIEQSPEELLDAGLAGLAVEPSTDSTQVETASTTDESTDTDGQQSQADADKGAEKNNGADGKPKADKVNASTTLSGEKAKGRTAQDRIRELNEKAKQAEERARLAEERAKTLENASAKVGPDGKPVVAEPRVIVPKPTQPKYSIEQLQGLKKQAREQGDEGLLEAVEQELEAWREYKVEAAAWEIRNGQAIREYDGTVAYWRQEAAKKWPELKDSTSPVFQTYQKVIQKFPEILKRSGGDGEFYAANLASILVQQKSHESVVGALKAENETMKKELEKLKGKMAPAKSRGESQDAGKPDDSSEDPDKWLSQQLGVEAA